MKTKEELCRMEQSKLIKLIDEGKLIYLPCKVGDTVYPITKRFGIIKASVYEIRFDNSSINFLVRGYVPYYSGGVKLEHYYKATFEYKRFGKTVFLTLEEAEKAKERENNGK